MATWPAGRNILATASTQDVRDLRAGNGLSRWGEIRAPVLHLVLTALNE